MKRLFTKISTATAIAYGSTLSFVAHAQTNFLPQGGVRIDGISTEGNLIKVILDWVQGAMVLLGIVAVLIIIWAGVRLIISQGNEEAVKSAKKTLIYAAAGFALIVLSGVIVSTILGFLTSPTSVTQNLN